MNTYQAPPAGSLYQNPELVFRVREPPVPDRGSAPARRLPLTGPALLRDAAPRPAQLLPLGPPEQVLRTPVSRWVADAQ